MTPAELRKLAQAAQGRPGAERYKARVALRIVHGYSDPATALGVADLWDALDAAQCISSMAPDGKKMIWRESNADFYCWMQEEDRARWCPRCAALDAMKGESDD